MYIAFEGIEGSGKSVQIKNVANFLTEKGFTYIITKEPGSTPIGNEIRKILLNGSFSEMSYLTEIFLYLADRAEHFEKIIKKNIEKTDFIISDRSLYSTVVYQGFGRGIDLKLLNMLNKVVTQGITPDYVFLFDCSVETGLKRALMREEAKNIDESRFERERKEFHERIKKGYLTLLKSYENWIKINSEKSIEEVEKSVILNLKKIIDKG